MESILAYLTETARLFGSNDPMVVVMVVVVALLVLIVVAAALRSSVHRRAEARRADALLARVDQLEASMAEFRNDVEGAVREFRALAADVHGDLGSLKKSTDRGGSEGGGSVPPAGTSGGGHGPGGGSGKTAAPATLEPQSSIVAKGLEKSRTSFLGKLKSLFSGRPKFDETSLDDLEEILITSDVGANCAERLVSKVREQISGAELNEESIKALLRREILSSLVTVPSSHRIYTATERPLVVLVVGVNGVGKTTTSAKLAAQWSRAGKKVLMVAADTFRAAAVQQLQEWGKRLDVPVVSGPDGCKPQTVVFDAMVRAKENGTDVVIIDTAGRLHTKSNLMQELEGVRNAVAKHCPGAPHETVLVLDGVSGQNALMQAREFHQATPLTGVVITKLDGTPRGGIVVAISQELSIPVYFIGVGERAEDLVRFSALEFVAGLLGDEGVEGESKGQFSGSDGASKGLDSGLRVH